ncbi:DsbA family protein [Rothia sp. ND6WE1A]|uniref:DsbA family protein n=1 Tax=Rothia sp. ND6WE1A TaxID=1848190 RepID=UPI000830F788|nr:DsbA family protein [Rothia sp. ND6WE1A]
MKIEMWPDIICPFCTIGKRHLELALEEFEHAEDAAIIWRSFELDPNAPDEVEGNVAEGVAQKYGISLEQSIESQKDVARRAQAPEIILGALRQVWVELQPQQTPQFIALDGTENASTCGSAGC